MTGPKSVTDAQLQRLLELVERERETRCSEVLDTAQEEARGIVRQAFHDARAHAREDLAALREQVRQRVNSAEAQQQTRARQQRQRADRELLDAAWQPLQQALQRLWQDAGDRQQWVAHLVDAAAATLLDTDWLIEHPPDWPAGEGEALQARLRRDYDRTTRLAAHAGIEAGLRISAGGACVDGSIAGLLRRRTHIEALLLAGIGRQRASRTNPAREP